MQERNGDQEQGGGGGKDEPLAAFADFSQTHTLQTQSSSQAPMSLLDSCSDNDSDFDKLIAEIADAQDQLQLLLNTTPNPKEGGGGGGGDETTSASFLMLDTATPTPTDVISCAAIGAGILPCNSSSNSSSTPQPLKSEEKTQGRKVGCGRGKQGVHELSNSSPRAAKKRKCVSFDRTLSTSRESTQTALSLTPSNSLSQSSCSFSSLKQSSNMFFANFSELLNSFLSATDYYFEHSHSRNLAQLAVLHEYVCNYIKKNVTLSSTPSQEIVIAYETYSRIFSEMISNACL